MLFHPLETEHLERVVNLLVAHLNRRMAPKNVRVEIDDSVAQWIIGNACTDRAYGARPLRRALQKHVEDPLSEEIIRSGGVGEDLVIAHVSVEGTELRFRVERRAKETHEAEVGAPA